MRAVAFTFGVEIVRLCTFGVGTPGAGGLSGLYPNLLIGLVYLGAALWMARSRRSSI